MFKDLKPGLQVHMLDKAAMPMKLYAGKVVKVSLPRVEMQKPDGMMQPFPNFQDRVVGLTRE